MEGGDVRRGRRAWRIGTAVLGGAASVLLTVAPLAAGELVKGSDWLHRWDGVKLVLSSHTGPTTDAVKVVAKKFADLTGAEVEVIDESWTDLLSKHLADAAAGGGTYDILTWPYIWTGHYVEGGLVAVLEIYGRYSGAASPNPDGLWSVPYKFDVYLAQYRTDLYEQAGIVDANGKAKPPETWAELLEQAKILAKKFPDMKPLVFPLAVDDPMVATFLPMLADYGGTIPIPWYDKNLYPEFQKEPGQQAVAILKKLKEYMPADVLDMDYDRVNAHMAQGLSRPSPTTRRRPSSFWSGSAGVTGASSWRWPAARSPASRSRTIRGWSRSSRTILS
jgi:ABC-type glycerol-3-phosphate transport system substrate-binding protein